MNNLALITMLTEYCNDKIEWQSVTSYYGTLIDIHECRIEWYNFQLSDL